MTRWATAMGAILIFANAAFAGDLGSSVVEPVVTQPPASGISFGSDWTGPYAGLQLGQLDATASDGLSGDDLALGAHAGYRFDFGRVVIGGEVDFDRAGTNLGAGLELDSILRGKVQAGLDFGSAFAYVTGGVAELDSSIGDDTGEFYGLGLSYRLSDRFTVGGEVLEHNFKRVGGGPTDVDATTVTVRGSLNF
ncbi:MAG: outer membrane beta-barrel protein [Rhodobacteraceae bacterium]|nr:outer membrane beta-barrel protein [Paracoccaceae bacterium]